MAFIISLSCSSTQSKTTENKSTQSRGHYVTPPNPATSDVNFYSRSKPYGEFSNFALFPIMIEGKRWPTSEHYYQAMKFKDKKLQELVRTTEDPAAAAKIGRTRGPVRKDWHKVKERFMWPALVAKYTQHDRLQKLLLSTGTQKIIEHTKNDDYWGDGGDGTGKNILGLMLMGLRDQIREDNGASPDSYIWK
ncbi:MAG: NADAR family protein [Deltaproteobacteria bacterium]|nr:MAG: NADAR family protein [Deltaproteobacteria bacterium]